MTNLQELNQFRIKAFLKDENVIFENIEFAGDLQISTNLSADEISQIHNQLLRQAGGGAEQQSDTDENDVTTPLKFARRVCRISIKFAWDTLQFIHQHEIVLCVAYSDISQMNFYGRHIFLKVNDRENFDVATIFVLISQNEDLEILDSLFWQRIIELKISNPEQKVENRAQIEDLANDQHEAKDDDDDDDTRKAVTNEIYVVQASRQTPLNGSHSNVINEIGPTVDSIEQKFEQNSSDSKGIEHENRPHQSRDKSKQDVDKESATPSNKSDKESSQIPLAEYGQLDFKDSKKSESTGVKGIFGKGKNSHEKIPKNEPKANKIKNSIFEEIENAANIYQIAMNDKKLNERPPNFSEKTAGDNSDKSANLIINQQTHAADLLSINSKTATMNNSDGIHTKKIMASEIENKNTKTNKNVKDKRKAPTFELSKNSYNLEEIKNIEKKTGDELICEMDKFN